MITVAVLRAMLGLWVAIERRSVRFERLGWFHRNRIVGVLAGSLAPDVTDIYEPLAVDHQGRSVSAHQRDINEWHEGLAQKYWHAARYPWLPVAPDSSPPD